MTLINMADMLGHACRHAYAVGAFGVVTLAFLEVVIRAAEVLEQCHIPPEAQALANIRAIG
ncbi:MAG: hypothetical protein PHZ14_10320 [Sulfuricella sp.]|jgi:fructose/tagatose bisphosphate aldolase|nr:hypothetical protein [Sulfuricella sp.]